MVYAFILLQVFIQIDIETRIKTQLMEKFLINSKKKYEETLPYEEIHVLYPLQILLCP